MQCANVSFSHPSGDIRRVRGLFVGSLVFPQVVHVLRGGAVFRSRGWDAWVVAPGSASQRRPGAGVLAVNGAAAFKVGFVPDDEAPVLGSAPAPRWRSAPSFTTMRTRLRVPRPGPPRRGHSSALVPARRSECARCPKRRRSARAPCSATPKAHRKHNESTMPSHDFLKIPRLPRL